MSRRLLPLSITVLLFLAMAAFGAIRYDGFLSPQVFLNLLIDNAFLCIVAVGMTFVILSGGIDLSVGAVIALTTMISGPAASPPAGTRMPRWRWCCCSAPRSAHCRVSSSSGFTWRRSS
jgi:ribose/xylose/arabinose/galactoside ABC-type transport system permease subunit